MADTENNKNSNSPAERTQDRNKVSSHAERRAKAPQGNSPALRFPGFTEPWHWMALSQVAPLQRGFDLPTDKVSDGEFPIVYSNGILRHHNEYKCVAPGVITGRSGTIGKLTYIPKGFYWPHNTSLWVTDFCGNSPLFIYYLYQTINIGLYATGSGVPTLNRNDVHRHKTAIPPLNEQEKIAEFLQLIDERIATQRRLIEDLERLKSSIVDRIFSDVDGEVVKYRDILEISTQRNDGKADYSILSASQEFGMIERDSLDIDIKAEAKSVKTYKRVHPGDYVLHLRSFQGGLAFAEVEGICSPAYTILRPNERLEYGYLKEYLNSSKFIKSLVLVTYGIRDGRSINVDEFLNMTASIHPKDKQAEIVKSLSMLSDKLNVETSILNRYEQQRVYLLGNLFI